MALYMENARAYNLSRDCNAPAMIFSEREMEASAPLYDSGAVLATVLRIGLENTRIGLVLADKNEGSVVRYLHS